MSGFKLSNNDSGIDFNLFRNKLNLSDIKESAKFEKIFKFFDRDGNGVLETSNADGENEIQTLLNGMVKYASSNGNSIFEIEEAEQYLNETVDENGETLASKNISVNDIFNFLKILKINDGAGQKDTEEYLVETLTEAEIREIAVQTLSDNSSKARSIFEAQNQGQGGISKGVNNVKEGFDTQYAASRVNRFILSEETCADLLQKAQNGELSEKEYLEAKLDLAVSLLPSLENQKLKTEVTKVLVAGMLVSLGCAVNPIAFEEKSDVEQELLIQEAEIALLKEALKKLTPEKLNQLIETIVNSSDEEYQANAQSAVENLIQQELSNVESGYKLDDSNGGSIAMKALPGTVGFMQEQTDAYRQMSFEEVFRSERGVDYNPEYVEDYAKKDAQMQVLLGMHNKRVQVSRILNLYLNPTNNLPPQISASNTEGGMKYADNDLKPSVAVSEALALVFGADTSKIQTFLDSVYSSDDVNKPKMVTDANGKFLSLEGDSAQMKLLAEKLFEKVDNNYQKALNGKTLQDYIDETGAAYEIAYGTRNSQNIAEGFVQSQQEGVQAVKTGLMVGSMVVVIAGQCVPIAGQVTTAALLTATFGGSAVSAIEATTKEGGMTAEDKEEIIEELATSLALTGTGMGIGKASGSVYNMVKALKGCPNFLARASEIGVDATMSLLADAAITGDIDLSGEGLSQLTNVLTGLLHSKSHLRAGSGAGQGIDNHLHDIEQGVETPKRRPGTAQDAEATGRSRKLTAANDADVSEALEVEPDIDADIIIPELDASLTMDEVKMRLKQHFEGVGDDDINELVARIKTRPELNTDENWAYVLDLIETDKYDKLLFYFANNSLQDLSCYSYHIGNINHPKAPEIVNKLLDTYPDDKRLPNVLGKLSDNNIDFVEKILANDSNCNSSTLAAILDVHSSALEKYPELISSIEDKLNKAYSAGTPTDFISILPQYIKADLENGSNICDFVIEAASIQDGGECRFSSYGVENIINSMPKPVKNSDLDNIRILMKNPDMTTTEIIKIMNGETVTFTAKAEYPFGQDGIYSAQYERLSNTDAFKNLNYEQQAKLHNYLSDLVNQDPHRFERLVDSGYFELCSQGKCNVQDLLNNIDTKKFFSKNYLEDVKRVYSGEPLVKEFASGTSLDEVAGIVPEGEAACVGGKLYVNDNGSMIQLNMSKEKFEELFPLEGRFNTQQKSLGNCWLVSELDNIMDLPSGRAKLYQLFSQEGNDIVVTIPNKQIIDGTGQTVNSPYVIRFKDGKVISNGAKQLQGCQGLQLIEQAYAVKRKGSVPENQGVIDIENLVDIDAQMDALNGGNINEFFASILQYDEAYNNRADANGNGKSDTYFVDANGNSKGAKCYLGEGSDDGAKEAALVLFEQMGNDKNVLMSFGTKHLDETFSANREHLMSKKYNLYSDHAYTVKGYDAERGLIYYTNPWDSNSIVEMDVYTFLSYIDEVAYMEIN